MMSRLMLNLHDKAAYGSRESTTEFGSARSTNVVFRVQLTTESHTTLMATDDNSCTHLPHEHQTEEYELRDIG